MGQSSCPFRRGCLAPAAWCRNAKGWAIRMHLRRSVQRLGNAGGLTDFRQAIGRASATGIRLRRAICRNIPHSNPQAWLERANGFEPSTPTLTRFARWLVGFAEARRSGARRWRRLLVSLR